MNRIDDIILKESEHKDDSTSKPNITGIVEFKNVGFQFEDDDKPLLNLKGDQIMVSRNIKSTEIEMF